MVKHSTSHGFAVFGGTITAAILVELLKPLLPEYFKSFEEISSKILAFTHLPMSLKSFNVLLIATILGLLWGIFFKWRIDK